MTINSGLIVPLVRSTQAPFRYPDAQEIRYKYAIGSERRRCERSKLLPPLNYWLICGEQRGGAALFSTNQPEKYTKN